MKVSRKIVTAAVLTSTLVLGACGGGDSGSGDAAGGDSSGGGGEVFVTLSNHPWTNVIEEKIPDFEEQTGIDVQVTVLGEDQLSDQYNVKLNAGATDVDVMMLRPLQEAKLFSSNGWLLPLDDQIEGASEEFNWDDFQAQNAVTTEEGIVAVPIVVEQEILYYRTDLLDAAGLEVPTTFEELRAAAETIQNENEDVYGFVARGQRAAAVTQFSSFLYGEGGDWNDGDTATIDTPEAKAAYESYGGLLRDFGPPGVTNMSWKEASAIFQQGQAAFYTDASVFYNNMIDPEQSRVGDMVGYAQMPGGDAGSKPYSIPSWGLGINNGSENVENAWAFIEWATSPEMTKEIQLEGVAGARNSVWEDPEGTSAFPEQLADVLISSAEAGVDHDRPVVVEVGRARDIVGAPIIAVLEGQDLDSALEQAQSEYQALLDDEQ
ncbi:ABC transporter substrate-binding protein [Georgenia muralis]|uniref:Carbohydrate ABC transporter substrate-binding protein (CUT1 family) n=1 Tax=Georgenia muralis TaxID=154117 RepID=A0A3N4Z784_9MICO|nr:sugar ABC transporter substrate-binding protein [Georgenia muralis]RPF27030.1 carbohydrate ABC transporter substrate-binding protein (CUT1 family) [Georgenia muralis]